MTEERLSMYRSNNEEIKEIKRKLRDLGKGDDLTDNSVIMDYRKGYPQPQAVVGKNMSLYWKRRNRYTNLLEKLEVEQDEIEEFIVTIEDGITRRIFQLRFLDGKSMERTGMEVHMDKSSVSRKIKKYLETCNKCNKNLFIIKNKQ